MPYQVSRNGQMYGPYTLEDLQRYVASGKHIMQSFITAKDGELIRDEAFPKVWPQ